jgi:mono/diheme cytochrome c family protein
MRKGFFAFLGSAAFVVLHAAEPTRGATAAVDFNRDVRPILSDNCFACHGPDEGQRQANLRLDTKEGIFADRGGYQVLTPGDAANSRIYQRISHEQEIARMPPPGSERTLTPQQIETIRKWIEQGAAWENHWAYVPPRSPPLPAVNAVDGKKWPRNAIDHFVLARLEKDGLKPSPETDNRTLLRRLSLDLTGLPPTLPEVEAFVNDHSPDAYEKVVDRLLKSPHYGERMAIQWLDLARYADTHGYHIDSYRQMWPWRDGSSTPSTAICRSTNSRSGSWPGICCPTRRVSSASPRPSTAIT